MLHGLKAMPENEQGSVFHKSLAEAIQASEELRRNIQHIEHPSSPLVLLDGTLLFLSEALTLLSSVTEEARDSLNVLQQCSLSCRNANLVAQRNPDTWMGGFPQLTVKLQQYSHTLFCLFLTKSR